MSWENICKGIRKECHIHLVLIKIYCSDVLRCSGGLGDETSLDVHGVGGIGLKL